MHQVSLTFEDEDVPPSRNIWWSRAILLKVSLTFTFMHWVILTFEDADTPNRAIWWSRALLHQVSLTFTFMHQVSLTFDDADVHSRMQLRRQWT